MHSSTQQPLSTSSVDALLMGSTSLNTEKPQWNERRHRCLRHSRAIREMLMDSIRSVGEPAEGSLTRSKPTYQPNRELFVSACCHCRRLRCALRPWMKVKGSWLPSLERCGPPFIRVELRFHGLLVRSAVPVVARPNTYTGGDGSSIAARISTRPLLALGSPRVPLAQH